jgi:mono/diheme cytochrome c family protein
MRFLTRLAVILVLLGVAGAVALAAIIFWPARRTPPVTTLPADWKPAPGAGEAVARAADCIACHTTPGGAPYAGGFRIDSPFGAIYSSNITPDRETGIGGYTLDEFRAALYDGVRQDGRRLYPAMPYVNYRKLSEEDVRALYDYFMNGVKPVSHTPKRTELAFPFNQRWGLRLWQSVALPRAGFTPHRGDATLDRGAYLVEALGHCGACHSPRNALFMESGLDANDPDFLSGGQLGDWPIPDLRAADMPTQTWPASELAAFLRTGRNAETGAAGEMSLTIGHSLQYLPQADLDALIAYLRAIRQDRAAPAVAARRREPQPTARKLTAAVDLTLGERLYLDNCNACHFADGRGARATFPALDGNPLVTAASPGGIISMILGGASMPSTRERPLALVMPGFAWRLNDDEVAALATFVRQGWSNAASAVTVADVAPVRARLRAAQAATAGTLHNGPENGEGR